MISKFHEPMLMSALLGATLSAMAIGPTSAGELYIYEHNLSVIDWFVVGDKKRQPTPGQKPALRLLGLRKGRSYSKATTKETGSSAPHTPSNPAVRLPPIRSSAWSREARLSCAGRAQSGPRPGATSSAIPQRALMLN
jgi:hypothetical protein